MKILVVNHASGNSMVGPNMRHEKIFGQLIKLNDKYKFTILGSKYFHKYNLLPPNKLNKGGIEFIYLNNLKYRSFVFQIINQHIFAISSLLWMIKNRRIKYDLIYFSSPPPIAFMSCFIFKFFFSKNSKLIFEFRDLWPEILIELKNGLLVKLYGSYLSLIVVFAYRMSDKIICVKEGEINYLKDKYRINPEKIKWVPNGMNPEKEFNNHKNIFFDKKSFNVIYIGAMSNYYDLEFIIKAISEKQINFCDFHFFGKGSSSRKLKKMAKTYGLLNVFFHEYQDKNKLESILSESDVGLLPLKNVKSNLYGISTNKIFDYIKFNLPIIGSYNSNFDPIEKFGIGFNVKYDMQLFKEKLLFIKNNKLDLKENFKKAKDLHSTVNLAKKLNEIIIEL